MVEMDTHATTPTARPASAPPEQDVSDAYLYLLGRLLVLRREHLDLEEGFRWNEIVHREPGGVPGAPLEPDVVCSEAWIVIDETTCTLLELPRVTGRYYTAQALNAWGETITNINERNYPAHPWGSFAFCMSGARMSLPPGTQRVDLPGRKARLVVRFALGDDAEEAVALQRRITLRSSGAPSIASPVEIPPFTPDALPGVEAFDSARAVLVAEPDINPGMDPLQTRVRAVAAAVARSPAERRRIDRIIRQQAWRALAEAVAASSTAGNGWIRPRITGNYRNDWRMRTVANYTGIWANTPSEVVRFTTAATLEENDVRVLTFPRDDLPESHAKYLWSVGCVDAATGRVIPNPLNRFVLNARSPLEHGDDGSLTLYFAPRRPPGAPEGNWLPTPAGRNHLLTWRSYGPDRATVSGAWFPPPLQQR